MIGLEELSKALEDAGINIGNYHSMLVQVVSISWEYKNTLDVLCRGARETDPLIILNKELADQFRKEVSKGDMVLFWAEMRLDKSDGYEFDALAFKRIDFGNRRKSFKVQPWMINQELNDEETL